MESSDEELDVGEQLRVIDGGTGLRDAENFARIGDGAPCCLSSLPSERGVGSEVLGCWTRIGPRNVGVDCESQVLTCKIGYLQPK